MPFIFVINLESIVIHKLGPVSFEESLLDFVRVWHCKDRERKKKKVEKREEFIGSPRLNSTTGIAMHRTEVIPYHNKKV